MAFDHNDAFWSPRHRGDTDWTEYGEETMTDYHGADHKSGEQYQYQPGTPNGGDIPMGNQRYPNQQGQAKQQVSRLPCVDLREEAIDDRQLVARDLEFCKENIKTMLRFT